MEDFGDLGVDDLGSLVDGVSFLFLEDDDEGLFIRSSTSGSGCEWSFPLCMGSSSSSVSSESDTYLLGLVKGKSLDIWDISSNMSSAVNAVPSKWCLLIHARMQKVLFG